MGSEVIEMTAADANVYNFMLLSKRATVQIYLRKAADDLRQAGKLSGMSTEGIIEHIYFYRDVYNSKLPEFVKGDVQ